MGEKNIKRLYQILRFWTLIIICLLHIPHLGASGICVDLIRKYESEHGIPKNLLVAIAKVESGRFIKHKDIFQPSPWVIQTGGKGHFFKTKEKAIAFVKSLLKKGIKNIDVGCLQVNLRYHGSSFESTEEALEPDKNIAYAAWYLKDLRLQHGSWSKAIARYHSANRKYHNPYRIKVYKMWARTRRHEYRRLAQERKARYAERLALKNQQQEEGRTIGAS